MATRPTEGRIGAKQGTLPCAYTVVEVAAYHRKKLRIQKLARSSFVRYPVDATRRRGKMLCGE